MMSKNLIYLFCILFIASSLKAQVIYERTYPDGFPSLKDAIQLSDLSTVSFANNSPCYFAGWRHIGPTGGIIEEGDLAIESTHSLKYKQIADDSVLVSCRVGPLDFDGTNYFQVSLWTPDSLYTLVLDTVFKNYWEDYHGSDTPVHYEAFLYNSNHVLYQWGDTIFSRNILTGQIEFRETFFHITHVYPVKNGLMIFSAGLPPTYFNDQLALVKTWLNLSAHPISFNDMVAIDSFIVGINYNIPTSLHVVNAFDEDVQDIDLSAYFSVIDSLVVRGDILMAIGRNGVVGNTLQLDRDFQILNVKPFVYPDDLYPWQLSFYPDRLYAWRTDGLSGYKADYRVAYQYLDPHPITYVDLEFVDIAVDSVFFWPPDHHLPAHLLLSALIINHSVDTLHNLTIHYEEVPIGGCDPGIYPRHVNDLKAPPGDTAVVKFWVHSWEIAMSKPFIRKYFVQHGNHQLDSNSTNNVFEFFFLISNAEEPIPTSLEVYPNPFTDFIKVSERSDLMQLNLYDQTGRLVSKGLGQLTDLGALPTGIYFLNVQTGSSNATTRVVKVE